MERFSSLFKTIHASQACEYTLLIAVAAVLPFYWRISLYLLSVLVISAVVSGVVTKRWGVRNLKQKRLFSLVAMGVLTLVYLASLLYCSNVEAGKAEVTRKMLLLAYAVTFIVFDWSFLNRKHLLGLLQFMTAALLIRFAIRLGISTHKIVSGEISASQCVGVFFDPMHHGYLSMYVLMSIAYLTYIALHNEVEKVQNKFLAYTMLIISELALTAYLFILQSRSGILGLILLAVGVLVLVFIKLRRYRLGVVLLSCFAVGVAVIVLTIPSSQRRLADTLGKVATHDQSDERYIISRASMNVVKANMPWGVGAGDRIDELVAEYQRMGAEKQYWRRYNPHNQFVDTLMTTGVVGLLVLLAIVILPTVECLQHKDYLFLAFLFIVSLSAMFESILERQMGINFFCFFYCMFIVENKEYNITTTESTHA